MNSIPIRTGLVPLHLLCPFRRLRRHWLRKRSVDDSERRAGSPIEFSKSLRHQRTSEWS